MSQHPLDPLSREELERAVAIMREAKLLEGKVRVVLLELAEPDKGAIEEFEADPRGEVTGRAAYAVLRNTDARNAQEVDISLDDGEVSAVRERTDIQPAVTAGEAIECKAVVLADPDFCAALERRGITDTSLLTVETWSIGDFVKPEYAGKRLIWCPCWTRLKPDDNPYARPIEGLYAVVDIDEMEVVDIEDHGAIPLPEMDGNYTADAVGPLRDDLRSLEITQPDGPSFSVDGWKISWQKWSLRVGFTPREGLVLYGIKYRDGDRDRSVLHRASFSELYVPYGDPSPGSYRRNGFDMGEFGIGPFTNSLTLGCDCLGDITYLDAAMVDYAGQAYTIPNAICLHEEDAGLLWKHTDSDTGTVEVRRSRRLVLSSIATADNYEYAFYWYFYQDGAIECEVKLTGIVLTSGVEGTERPQFGRLVAPGVAAPNHQHFFNVRLDMDVDGPQNTAYEVHAESATGADNPHGNAFRRVATPLRTELQALGDIDPMSGRYWRIENPGSFNAFGEPVAYKLIPGANAGPMALSGASARRRARFVDRHVWVTPNNSEERYASGQYPNQSSEDAGLAKWVEQDREIENEDIVLWYTFSSTHMPRPEDWPVMPVDRIGFMLKPDGFFDRSPALDVPPPEDHSAGGNCRHESGGPGDTGAGKPVGK